MERVILTFVCRSCSRIWRDMIPLEELTDAEQELGFALVDECERDLEAAEMAEALETVNDREYSVYSGDDREGGW